MTHMYGYDLELWSQLNFERSRIEKEILATARRYGRIALGLVQTDENLDALLDKLSNDGKALVSIEQSILEFDA